MKKLMPWTAMLLLLSCSPRTKQETVPLTGSWIEITPNSQQFIQGMTLDKDGSANSIGMATLIYQNWVQTNKQLILYGKSIGNGQTISFSDTLNIVHQTNDTLILERANKMQLSYSRLHLLDSLKQQAETGPVLVETYQGTLPAASCPGIEYTIDVYHQQHSGDGVFRATLNYLEAENGKDQLVEITGRQYTLRGHTTDPNATVIQLKSFDEKETMNFCQSDNSTWQMLDQKMTPIQSNLNYTLKRTR